MEQEELSPQITSFTNCKLADFLFTKDMRLVSTVRKNKPEIQALFFSFGFPSDLTLVS